MPAAPRGEVALAEGAETLPGQAMLGMPQGAADGESLTEGVLQVASPKKIVICGLSMAGLQRFRQPCHIKALGWLE